MVTEGKMKGSLVMEDLPEVLHQRLGQLNQLRKSRHFCDVVLQVSHGLGATAEEEEAGS